MRNVKKLNTTIMKKYDIFISYSRKDFDEVNQIVEMLKSRIPTLSCWFDITGIESGDEFEDKIIAAIKNSSYVLFALSDNSNNSKYARKEVTYAQNIKTRVIPLLLKDSELKEWFLFNFGNIDCIDSTNSLQMEKLIKNLADWTGKSMANASDTSSSYCSKTTSSLNKKQKAKQDSTQASSPSIHTIYDEDGNLLYEGEMKDGKFHGQGTLYDANGDKYVGQFKKDVFHGIGTLNYANGNKYEGQFEDGVQHGNGTKYFANGDKYVGQFEYSIIKGTGIYFYANGDKYEGECNHGSRHGQGILYLANGDKYEGKFEHDDLNGKGTLYFANGSKYIGSFKDGEQHGEGTLYFTNDNKYVGGFKNGKRHGKGVFFYKDGNRESVIYEEGELTWREW